MTLTVAHMVLIGIVALTFFCLGAMIANDINDNS